MKVRLTKDFGGHKANSIVEGTYSHLYKLINKGTVVPVNKEGKDVSVDSITISAAEQKKVDADVKKDAKKGN